MNFFEERIVKDGIVRPGNVLKVDSFLNHQMDIALMEQIGREFKRRFGHKPVTKVLTIEASGIAVAHLCGQRIWCSHGVCQKVQVCKPGRGDADCRGGILYPQNQKPDHRVRKIPAGRRAHPDHR